MKKRSRKAGLRNNDELVEAYETDPELELLSIDGRAAEEYGAMLFCGVGVAVEESGE